MESKSILKGITIALIILITFVSNFTIVQAIDESNDIDITVIDKYDKNGSAVQIIENISVKRLENASTYVCFNSDSEEMYLKSADVYQLNELTSDSNMSAKTTYVADLYICNNQTMTSKEEESDYPTRGSGSVSNTQMSNGRIRIKSPLWYNTFDGTGASSSFTGIKPYKVGGQIMEMPNSTVINSITGELKMQGQAFIYPKSSSTSGPYSQTITKTFNKQMGAQTRTVSPVSNRYYVTDGGTTYVKFTYKVSYTQMQQYSGTAQVTVFANPN